MKMRWAKMTAVSIKVRVAGREPGLKRARKIVNNRKWFPKGKIGGQPTRGLCNLLCQKNSRVEDQIEAGTVPHPGQGKNKINKPQYHTSGGK